MGVGSEYMGRIQFAPAYQDILQKKLLPAAQEWYEDENEGWELQQDKASCHTANVHRGLVGAAWRCGGGRVAH